MDYLLYNLQYYYQYYLFMLPGVIFALIASMAVKSTFNRYSGVTNNRGLTGADAAKAVLRAAGVTNVDVERVSGSLTDHFDPRSNVIRLSDTVYSSCSVAAIGVAAHEAGHAVQYATSYAPIKIRAAIVPAVNIGGQLSIPLIILGSIFTFDPLIYVGLALFSLLVLFKLITLPVEFNASRRALQSIDELNLLSDNEYKGAKKVLTAAAMTYVASLVQAILSFLYYFLRTQNRRR